MKEEDLAKYLQCIVKEYEQWDEDFVGLVIHRESTYTVLEWTDSGAGEEYVTSALAKLWPDRKFDLDMQGGCDSCGFGRYLSLTISGATPPWEGK